ncbi:hypothetical protein [Actinomadura madurae]|nr:hypothetical protein [Actinomadura madurae]MCQ0020992.1 hypothetical protein [Actinomadura madurae]
MRVLPALPGGGDHFGLKVMGGRRAGHGRPYTAQYLVVLFDKVSGAIAAFVDARRSPASAPRPHRRSRPGG